MNFLNPYISIYFKPDKLYLENSLSFEREVYWTFLKNLDSRLGLRRHRLNLVFTNNVDTEQVSKIDSIYTYNKLLTESLKTGTEQEQRLKLLDIIYEAFIAVSKKFSWDLAVIQDAYLKSISEINHFEYVSKWKANRIKTFNGRIKLDLQKRLLTISVIIVDKVNSTTKQFTLLKTDEDNFSWNKHIKEFGWYDNNKFGLKFLSGEYWIFVDLEKDELVEFKNLKTTTEKQFTNFLRELKSLPPT